MSLVLDDRALPEVLGWIGASDPGASDRLDELEARVGAPLCEETRALLRAAPELRHPDAEDHPEIDDDLPFAAGLPDVDAFIGALGQGLLGPYLAVAHFVGAIPVGVQLQYGDHMFAFARITPWDGRHGGMLYYDEREIGTWGSTVAGFLHAEIASFRKHVDGQLDDLDEDERAAFRPALDELRDCFVLRGCDWRGPTPEGTAPGGPAWDEAWHADMRRFSARTWMPAFLRGRVDPSTLRALPRRETWEAEKSAVGAHYGDTMYWLVAHALLGNTEELEDARQRAASHPSTHVQAVLEAAPGLVERFGAQRDALYAVASKAL